MEENLKNEVLRLISLKRTTKNDVDNMIKIIRENIDPKFNVCTHCVAQIKFAQTQLLNWYNRIFIDEPLIPQMKIDEGCSKCKKRGRPKKNM